MEKQNAHETDNLLDYSKMSLARRAALVGTANQRELLDAAGSIGESRESLLRKMGYSDEQIKKRLGEIGGLTGKDWGDENRKEARVALALLGKEKLQAEFGGRSHGASEECESAREGKALLGSPVGALLARSKEAREAFMGLSAEGKEAVAHYAEAMHSARTDEERFAAAGELGSSCKPDDEDQYCKATVAAGIYDNAQEARAGVSRAKKKAEEAKREMERNILLWIAGHPGASEAQTRAFAEEEKSKMEDKMRQERDASLKKLMDEAGRTSNSHGKMTREQAVKIGQQEAAETEARIKILDSIAGIGAVVVKASALKSASLAMAEHSKSPLGADKVELGKKPGAAGEPAPITGTGLAEKLASKRGSEESQSAPKPCDAGKVGADAKPAVLSVAQKLAASRETPAQPKHEGGEVRPHSAGNGAS